MKSLMTIDDLAALIKGEFDRVDERFEQIDRRFDHVEQRLGNVENNLYEVRTDVRKLTGQFNHFESLTDARIRTLEAKSA